MEYTLKTILYATDLGPHGPDVARHATGLAQHFGAKLHVVYVIEPISHFADSVIEKYLSKASRDTQREQAYQEVREEFEQRLQRFCEDNLITPAEVQETFAGMQVMEGSPAATILTEADRLDADLIVLGDRGHSALDEMLIGSVARRITMTSKRPVLLVPIPK